MSEFKAHRRCTLRQLSSRPQLGNSAAHLMVQPTHILMLALCGWVGRHVYFLSLLHRRAACWQCARSWRNSLFVAVRLHVVLAAVTL